MQHFLIFCPGMIRYDNKYTNQSFKRLYFMSLFTRSEECRIKVTDYIKEIKINAIDENNMTKWYLCMIWAKYVCGYLSYDNSMTKVVLNYMIMNIFGA